MLNVKGNNNLLVMDRKEYEAKLKEEYEKGFADGSKSAKTTTSKAKNEIKAGGRKTVVRNTVVEKADE